ncbi:MAG: hypothetical protein BVN34_08620 [Proteobacteria bacterium ST_bin12]|nr:MAG: hypothetical protein BVN34_08620 [Proteobacteria bacterium ST_bin12]
MFVGRYSVEVCGPWSDFALINIGESDASEGYANIQDGWHDVLRLSFHDILPSTPDPDGVYALMRDKDAKAIVDFVRYVAPNVEGIIVHCKAGISRSAAVAKWICGDYNLPFNVRYTKYNQYIYLMILMAAQDAPSKSYKNKLRTVMRDL